MKTSEMTTRMIAGHKITLTPGIRYIACRPFAIRGVQRFDVTIECLDAVIESGHGFKVPGLTYDQANEFLAAFNNGPTSFEGRVWE